MALKGENSAYFQDGRVRSGQDYVQIMGEVMRSEAYRSIPDYAARVLFALAAGFRKTNNGDLSLTAKDASKYGVVGEWKLRAGLAVLERVGLIECQRRGHIMAGKGICSLYALGWRQIDPSNKYDTPTVMAVRAPNGWASWRTPATWQADLNQLRQQAKGKRRSWKDAVEAETSHPTRGEQAASHVGSESSKPRRTRGEQESAIPASHVGVPFKNLASTSRPKPLGQQLADSNLDGLMRVARANPMFTPDELAKVCKTSVDAVHRALQAMQAGAV